MHSLMKLFGKRNHYNRVVIKKNIMCSKCHRTYPESSVTGTFLTTNVTRIIDVKSIVIVQIAFSAEFCSAIQALECFWQRMSFHMMLQERKFSKSKHENRLVLMQLIFKIANLTKFTYSLLHK